MIHLRLRLRILNSRGFQGSLRMPKIEVPTTVLETPSIKLPPSGRVELKRRRVTEDGRVKLKLTLMNVVVNKCGICMSQFKEAEIACHGGHCAHR